MNKEHQIKRAERTTVEIQRDISKMWEKGYPRSGSRRALKWEELRLEMRRAKAQESVVTGEGNAPRTQEESDIAAADAEYACGLMTFASRDVAYDEKLAAAEVKAFEEWRKAGGAQ
jgi:hypothetical protein